MHIKRRELRITDAKRWFMKRKQWRLFFYGTRFDSISPPPPPPPPPNITYIFCVLTSREMTFQNEGDSEQNTKTWYVVWEWALNDRMGECTHHFFSLCSLGPSISCLPPLPPKKKTISEVLGIPPPQKKKKKECQFCISTWRKSPRIVRNNSKNSQYCNGPLQKIFTVSSYPIPSPPPPPPQKKKSKFLNTLKNDEI